jgi:hypothetical protein
MRPFLVLAACLAAACWATPAAACDLCAPQGPPLSVQVEQARMVLFGPVVSSRLGLDGTSGTSELKIEAVVKPDDHIKGRATVSLPRYVPADPKVKFLVFLDIVKGQLDPYRGVAFNSGTIVNYLRNAPASDPKADPQVRAERLRYFFKFLNDQEPEIAADAFKEWATASNLEVGLAAGKLSAEELRAWLMNPKTPAPRLSLYSFLLGACGTEKDAELLRRLILNPDDRMGTAIDGLLAGYIRLRPDDGWKLTLEVAGDPKRPFTQRHAIVRLLRFYHGYQPQEARDHLLRCTAVLLKQPDIMDIAVDQLRQWKLWNLTDQVLALYKTKDADAPITKRAIIRYALSCPETSAKQFIKELRRTEADLVNDVQESLRIEAPPNSP